MQAPDIKRRKTRTTDCRPANRVIKEITRMTFRDSLKLFMPTPETTDHLEAFLHHKEVREEIAASMTAVVLTTMTTTLWILTTV